MGANTWGSRSCGCYHPYSVHSSNTFISQGNAFSGNGNGTHNGNGILSLASGNLDGNLNGNSVNVAIL